MSYAGYGFNNMSVSEEVTVKHPTSSLLVIDSEDRNVASAINVGPSTSPEKQPWNNFRIQTPDRLATGSINRITLKSIRFPWYIPPINSATDTLIIKLGLSSAGPFTTVYAGLNSLEFQTPSQVATAINQDIALSAPAFPFTVRWVANSQQFIWSWGNTAATNSVVYFQPANNLVVKPTTGPATFYPLSQEQFATNPSLARVMGFNYGSLTFSDSASPRFFTYDGLVQDIYPCSGTDFLYTRYVDIVSTRLLQYRRMIDGASKNSNKKALITRVYCANENSQNSYDISGNIIPIGSQPFVIHRQICEKSILWNSEATIDYLDFQVYDEFGNFVIPPSNAPEYSSLTYPSFQMTFVLSE